jgi:hypothetical protein
MKGSTITIDGPSIITIDGPLTSRDPSRISISISIRHPTQLAAPHKLRQQYTHISVCKVVLRAKASARCCAPVSPMLLCRRLHGWREQRHCNSMVTIILIDCLWLFSWRPTRLALTGRAHWYPSRISATQNPFTTLLSCHVLHTSLYARQTPSPDSITLTQAPARSCCAPGPLQDAAPRHRRCSYPDYPEGCGVSTNLHESNESGSFLQIARTVLQTVAEGKKR